MRKYSNENGQVYTILKGGVGGPALLVKHSHPDGIDFILTRHLSDLNWSNADYIVDLKTALEAYDKVKLND